MNAAIRTASFCLLVAIGVWAQGGASTSEGGTDITVTAQGMGPTREAAITAAQRAAVEQGVGQILTSETEIKNFMLQRDQIVTRSVGRVRRYEVQSETRGPDGVFDVTIQAVVSDAGLRDDLVEAGIILACVGNPRVAVLVAESRLGALSQEGDVATEAAIIQFLRERNFEIVEPTEVLRAARRGGLEPVAGGDVDAMSSLGAEVGAEVVIAGTATATESQVANTGHFAGTSMKSASATVTLKAVNVSSRQILAMRTSDGSMVHINPLVAATKALERAAQSNLQRAGRGRGGEGLYSQLMESWRRSCMDGTTLRVRVRNIPSFQAVNIVRDELAAKSQRVQSRRYAGGVLFLDVTFRGTAQDFSASVDGMAINQGRNRLAVESVEGDQVVLTVR